ncbi:FMRFamide receptor-like [Dreissena polymorpha]|uniref:G-protein coupled receptors family 1 profile domain-containing protein n=1 Tax=Dreissena polymorpha TaxID=45954 RepID=A0A9D4QQM5_DREPO|nr:FMRFamide receptor-like [Dreissena polymorpha]XP_052278762.1 FMRFamide receptor-like [Dreissena polymorpha]XP_052278763.1 FMRFamide receptor-like [Dreissena polymorpha]KAH3839774.1 hypothetical protein DPMN_113211 [Dreissena polymorpha]
MNTTVTSPLSVTNNTIVSNVSVTDGSVEQAVTMGTGMEITDKIHFATSAIIGPIFVFLGLVGNILSILVWRRRKMRSSTGTYLIGQAIADMGLLVFFLLTDSIFKFRPSIATSSAYGAFYAFVGYPIFFMFLVCSIWFTVGVTVDRYIQVCWINKAKEMCSEKRAWIGLGLITLLCFFVNTPHFATYEPVPDVERNGSDAGFRFTEYGSTTGNINYELWVLCMMILEPVPWAIILTLNLLIIKRVTGMNRQMNIKRGSSGKEIARKSETQLTRLLLTVTFTFLALTAPRCIMQCFVKLKSGDHVVFSKAFAIAKLGVVINSSINFFLYCLSGKRFRKELRSVVCARFRGDLRVSETISMSERTWSSTISRTKSTLSEKSDLLVK